MTDNILTQPTPVIAPIQHVAAISHTTYVQALANAFTTTRYAICMEFSVSLSLFHESGVASAESKAQLQQLYAAALFDCTNKDGSEYKSVRRKIQLASLLFQFIGNETIGSWVSGAVELSLLNAIVSHLQAMNIRSYESVLTIIGRPRPAARQKAIHEELLAEAKLPSPVAERRAGEHVQQATAGGLYEAAHVPLQPETLAPQEPMYRRASDKGEEGPMDDSQARLYSEWLASHSNYPVTAMEMLAEGYREIKTEHVGIAIAVTATKQEIVAAAMRLMSLASSMLDDTTLADLPSDELEEATVAPAMKEQEAPQTLQEVIADFQEREKAKALESAKASVEPEEEDLEEIKRHQQQEIDRIAAEKKAAMIAAKPVAQAAPSRYRAKPISKK